MRPGPDVTPEGPPLAVDTHAHLNHPRLQRRLPALLARAQAAGIVRMIVVGYDLPSSEEAVRLAELHPHLWATVGIHPHDATTVNGDAVERLRELARSARVVAIGETGLDYYRDLSPREAQIASLRAQLALAGELGLPVVLHCREAQEALLGVLRSRESAEPPAVWHCFDGTEGQAEAAIALGAMLGFAGIVTYRRSEELRQVAAGLLADRLLLETDSPYLAPEPHRGRDNEPANLPLIAHCLAQVRATSSAELLRLAGENATRVFRLPPR